MVPRNSSCREWKTAVEREEDLVAVRDDRSTSSTILCIYPPQDQYPTEKPGDASRVSPVDLSGTYAVRR